MSALQPEIPAASDGVRLVEYATAVDIDPAVSRTARGLLMLAIFSGLCVAVCFMAFLSPLGAAAHAIVFAITIWIAVRTNARATMLTPRDVARLTFDLIALAGLCMIALMPLGYFAAQNVFSTPLSSGADLGELSMALVAVAFLLLAGTTWRHWMLYREIAAFCRLAGWTGLRRSFVGLGAVKTFYEFAWLGCCCLAPTLLLLDKIRGGRFNDAQDTAIYVAVGAFFGCIGFGGIWIWMMINHALLMRATRRAVRLTPTR